MAQEVSFNALVISLASSAAVHFGDLGDPVTGEKQPPNLLAARHAGTATEFVVRVPSIDPVLLKRLLDAGVRSFMFPCLQTVGYARLAVASTRYPPHGMRGWC